MDIIHVFALRQAQAHSDTRGIYTHTHTATRALVFKTADVNRPNPKSVSFCTRWSVTATISIYETTDKGSAVPYPPITAKAVSFSTSFLSHQTHLSISMGVIATKLASFVENVRGVRHECVWCQTWICVWCQTWMCVVSDMNFHENLSNGSRGTAERLHCSSCTVAWIISPIAFKLTSLWRIWVVLKMRIFREILPMVADTQLKKYVALHVKCPKLLTNCIQSYIIMKFRENP